MEVECISKNCRPKGCVCFGEGGTHPGKAGTERAGKTYICGCYAEYGVKVDRVAPIDLAQAEINRQAVVIEDLNRRLQSTKDAGMNIKVPDITEPKHKKQK